MKIEADSAAKLDQHDMDLTQNSNVKWLETSTSVIKQVEHMCDVINKQENSYLEGAIKKKDIIIQHAED